MSLIKKRRKSASNSKFDIFFYHLIDNNEEIKNYLVVKPKVYSFNENGRYITGTVIVPIFQSKIGLIRIFRPSLEEVLYEFPHGLVDEGESPEESAKRELLEEMGLSAGTFKSLGYITPDPGVVSARIECYLALNCKDTQPIQYEIGLSGVTFFTVEHFEKMIKNS